MKRFLLIALLALPGQLFGQTVLNFPRILSGSDLITGLRIVNPTNQEVSITVTAFEATGSPLVKPGISNPYTAAIPAGGNYARLISEIYGTDSINGWVQVTSAASGLTGFALNSNQANTDVDGAIAAEPASEFILPFAAADSVARTEVTLVNVNNDPAQVTLTLYGADGTALGTKSQSLASKALLRQNLQLLFPGIELSAASHVKVRADRPLAGLEVVADFQIPGVTLRREIGALPGQRSLSDLVYVVPQFVTGTPWASYLQVVNGSGVSQEVTLTAYGQDGTPFSGGTNPRRETVPGNGAFRVSAGDYFGLPANQVSTGWIEVRGSVGYLNVVQGHGNTLTSSFAMTAATPAGEASRAAVHNYFAETPGFSSAIYVVNNGSDTGTADVYVLRADGSTVGHSTLSLASKQQVSRYLQELIPASRDLSTAWVIVRSSVPAVSVLHVSSAIGAGLAGVARQPLTSDFVPPNQTTASISGTVAQDGIGAEGVTVRLTGPVVATKTTDSSGHYVFTQLPAGDYTVAVSKPGVQFIPSERSVTLARENLAAINFGAIGVVAALKPSISLLSPSSAFGASSALNISVFGSSFNHASAVFINSQELQTSFVSATELKAVVPVDLLKLNSVLRVSVFTPPLGGGTSNSLDFLVNEVPQNPLIEGRIAVGKFPAGVAIDEGLNMVVVSNESDDNVSLINLKTLEGLGPAAAGRSPAEGIAIHDTKNLAFVGNAGSNDVSVIDLNTRTEKKRIKVGRLPVGVAVAEALDKVFVANGDENTVSVIDANSLTVVATINVGSKPAGIAVSPAGNTGVVTNRGENTVSIIDLNSLTVMGVVAVEKSPRGVAIDPVTNNALVVNAGSNTVSMVDIAKRAVAVTVGVGVAPTGIAIHTGSHSAVVTNSGVTSTSPNSGAATTVSIINLDELSVLEVPVEAAAFGVAIDQQGQRAFVANFRSNVVSVLRIPNPQPRVGTVEPKTFPVGGGAFTITVRGTGFLPTSVVTLNGKPLATKYISPTELQAQVTPELLDELLKLSAIQTGGDKGTVSRAVTLDFKIEVTNPGPGGGTSLPPKDPEATKIEPINALPLLTNITPTSAETGKDVVVTLSGNNFSATSIINFGGNAHSPTTVTPTQMSLRLLAAEIRVGEVPVSVTNLPPGGGTSDILKFRVFDNANSVPSVSSVAPSEVAAGTSAVDVVVSGSGFIAATSVKLGGVAIPATVRPNTIEFHLNGDLLRSAASLAGLITNPSPGGGTASFSLNVLNPVPSVSGFSPTEVDSKSSAVELQIRGARFVESSSVIVEGTPLPTRFVDATEIRATLAEGFLKTPRKLRIGVSNPAPGGGVSDGGTLTVRDSVLTLTITPAGPLNFSALGLKQTLVAAVTSGGQTIPTAFQWSSSNAGVVTISDAGVLTTIGNGTATLLVKAGDLSGSVSVSVAQAVSSVEVSPNSATLSALGQTSQFFAVARDSNGSAVLGEPMLWASTSPTVATVNANGLVTAVGNGSATIVAKAKDVSGSASVTVGQTVGAVEVSPKSVTLNSFGETTQLSAVVKDSNGSPVIGETITWVSMSPSVATVNANGLVTAVGNGTATIVAKAKDLSGSASVTVGQTVSAVEVSPQDATLTALGQTSQFSALAKDSKGSTIIAETMTWTSTSPSVATVNSSGLVTAIANGTATIVAKAGDASASALVTVAQTVSSVTVSPLSFTLTSIGETKQFAAVARDSNGVPVTGAAMTWTSTSPSVATVNSSGLATAVANGTATIQAAAEGKTGTAQLTVAEILIPPVINTQSAPLPGLLPAGMAAESDDFLLTINGANYSNDALVTFGATNLTPKTVTPSAITVGVPTSLILSPGALSLTVTAHGGVSNAVSFIVGNPVVDVTVAPSTSITFAALGLAQTFTATAKTTGGTVVPKVFQWTSSNTSVATVSDAGLVTAVGNGTATVVATADGLSASVAVAVGQVVHSVEVSPSSSTLTAIGATAQYSVVVRDSNSQAIAGKTIDWSSDAPGTAAIDNSGLATAAANGATMLRASVDGKQGTVSLTVSQAVATVEVSPAAAALSSLNLTQVFAAVARDAKGVVITGKTFAWTSSTIGIATLSGTSGVTSTTATAVGNGNTSIEASVDGKTGSGGLLVSQVADSVQVSTDPAGASTTLTSFGATLQLRALVKDANNQTINGKAVAWVSESPEIAGVSSTGQVTALANGSALIRATAEDKTATLSVTVGQVADSLSVTPSAATLTAVGSKQRFTGTLRDANGNPMQGTLTWSSSLPSAATIASVDALNADATAVAAGTTTLTASIAGKTATATLIVTPAAATIEISPETRTLDALSDTFTFTPTIKDELGTTLTGQTVAWESTSPAIATVHASTGLVTAVANGSTTIKATVGGKTATAQLIVAQAVDSIAVAAGAGSTLSARTGAIRNGVYTQIFAASSAPTMTSLGDERVFTAVAKDRKGNTIPGKDISWTSSQPDIVTVDSTGKATAVGNGTASIVASVEGKSGSVNQFVEQVVATVSVSPNSATLTSFDETIPLTAVIRDARGFVVEGKSVIWSSTSAAATVSSGLVTAVSEGIGISINASIGAKTGSAAIVVHQEVSTIEVTPDRRHFNLHGQKQIFDAKAKDARGHEIAGRGRSWSSSRSDLAEVTTSGEVTAKGNGAAVISVMIDGKTAVSTVTVAQNAARIEIDQSSWLFEGLKESKPLLAHFFNELGVEVLKGITWTSSNTGVATISGAGVLTAEGNGVTTITATADGISASISVRVNQKLHHVEITQVGSGKLRALGRKRQFFAKAVDRNGFEIPGKGPKWKSSNDGIAGINESGEATGKFNGLVTITAEIEGMTVTVTLEIDQLAHHIEHVSGSGKLKAFNRSRQLRVLDEDGNPIIGKIISWSSSDGDIALVDIGGVAKSNRKNGKAKIRATVEGVIVETDLDVDQDVASIEVSADGTGRIPALNRKRKHTAIARDPDGNLVVGKSIEWLTSDSVTGPIDSDGFVTAKKNGKVQIFARIGGLTSLPIDFEVFQTTISVTVAGESSGKIPALNRKRKHTAVAKDPDGNIIEGRVATWTSSRGDLAPVNSSGEVTAKGNGTTRIKVVIDGVEGSLDIEVDQQLSAVLSNETGKIKALNRKRQYRAVDPDGSDIAGKTVTWSTSDGVTASVQSGTGVAQGKKNGTARITATVGVQIAFTDMEILQEVASVTISTTESGKITALKHKRRAAAVAKDADGYEITGRTVNWISSDTTILIVNSLGDAEAQRNGSGRISAAVDGVASNALTFEVSQVIAVVVPASGQTTGKFKSKNETRQYLAKDANGNAIEKPIEWRVGDSAVADVDGTGKVTSRRNKKTAVRATVDGVTVSSDVDVEQEAVKIVIDEGKGQLRANSLSKTLTLEATGYDAKGEAVEDKAILWSVDKPFIATVTQNGTVTAGKGISGTIRVTAKMDDATATIELDVR